MDKAINKSTGEIIDALEVFKNGSYQNLTKGEWLAPKDSIFNWEELQKQGISDIAVHYVTEAEFITKRGKNIWRCPHFSLYANSPAKSTEESQTHKILKDWLFNHLKNNDLELLYAKGTKPHKYENKVRLSELPINWNDYEIEVHTKGTRRLIADILIPFKKRDWLLGNGVIFEIQLSPQSDKKTHERTIERALHGYSVCWLFYEDFNIEEDNISLKDKTVNINSFSESMHLAKSEFIKDLRYVVEEQCRFLDEKIKETNIAQKELDKIRENITEIIKSETDDYFNTKLNELSRNLNEEVIKRIENKFFEDNSNKIINIIKDYLPKYISEQVIKESKDKINYNEIISNIKLETKLSMQFFLESIQPHLLLNSLPKPICPKCNNSYNIKLISKKDKTFVWLCNNRSGGCGTWINIPKQTLDIIKKVNNGEKEEYSN